MVRILHYIGSVINKGCVQLCQKTLNLSTKAWRGTGYTAGSVGEGEGLVVCPSYANDRRSTKGKGREMEGPELKKDRCLPSSSGGEFERSASINLSTMLGHDDDLLERGTSFHADLTWKERKLARQFAFAAHVGGIIGAESEKNTKNARRG